MAIVFVVQGWECVATMFRTALIRAGWSWSSDTLLHVVRDLERDGVADPEALIGPLRLMCVMCICCAYDLHMIYIIYTYDLHMIYI